MQQTTLGEAGASRENNFDILRLCFAALVLFSHSFALPVGDNRYEPLVRLTNGQTSFGALAVDGFFVISGFLVTQSWLRSRGLGDYLKKRILRIYPGFLVAALFCALVVGPLAAPNAGVYLRALPFRLVARGALKLELSSLPPTFVNLPFPNIVNGALWTIRYEFWCYLLVALLGLTGLLRRRVAILVLFLLALALHGAQEWVSPGFMQGNRFAADGLFHGRVLGVLGALDVWPRFLAFFLAGMAFTLYQERIPRSRRWLWGALAVLAFSCRHGLNVCLPVFGAYVLLYAAFHPVRRGVWLTRRGDFSYGVYLYAFPIQQSLVLWLGPSLPPLALFLLALPPTFGLAFLSWNLVEQPCLRWKRPTPKQIPTG